MWKNVVKSSLWFGLGTMFSFLLVSPRLLASEAERDKLKVEDILRVARLIFPMVNAALAESKQPRDFLQRAINKELCLGIMYLPSGIDIYFDNVGGAMLDAALLNMRPHGRIAVCGVVSQQGISDTEGIHSLFCLVTKRIRMQGFLQRDYRHLFFQFLDCMANYYEQGKIVYIEDMSEGLDSAPGALVGLCTGKNVGKQVVCISRERLVSY